MVLAKKLSGDGASEPPGGIPVVVLGASAGGMSALKAFFSTIPADTGAAFVVVPHLDPRNKSLVPEVVARQTPMQVCEIEASTPLMANRVYVSPPGGSVAIDGGLFTVTSVSSGQFSCFDTLLESLAREVGGRGVAVVLSGTGSHGVSGVRALKLAGGMIIAQSPSSAEFEAMPRAAIATGLVDFVLPPEEMARTLDGYLRHPYVNDPSEPSEITLSQSQVDRICALLKSHTKYDFSSYRKNMFKRRVMRRIGLCQSRDGAEYLEHLANHMDEVDLLYQDLLIGVTDFFRDPGAFDVLAERIIPELVSTKSSIRVWVPACATGEEAYTLGMLFIEEFASQGLPINLQIFATDIDERSLDAARQGVYDLASVANVAPARLKRFFVKVDDKHWRVNKELRKTLTFAPQNLISDSPFSRLDLISCRNLLIYLEPELQAKVIRLFHFSLADGGYLLLGPSESVGRDVELFEPISKKWRLFRRIASSRHSLSPIPIMPPEGGRQLRTYFAENLPTTSIGFKEWMQRVIIDEYAPAAALINHRNEIISVLGPLVDFLEFPPGQITKDILAMVRTGLRTKLRAAIDQTIRTRTTTTVTNARVKRDGDYVACTLAVKPLNDPKGANDFLLVTFRDAPEIVVRADTGQDGLVSPDDLYLLQNLEQELSESRTELQSMIEDYETTFQELKASNEEIMSMNEELQSANEELETSKEELQSLNEELNSINLQLQEKVEELDRVNSDLSNLMASGEVATIFLDPELRIKRFTPPIAALLSLLPTDIDRPLSDFAFKFSDDSLLEDCAKVLLTGDVIEHEVWTKSPRPPLITKTLDTETRCYLRRVLPYRNGNCQVSGVVVTLVDITARIRSEIEAKRLANVLWHSNDAITVQDFDGGIIAWSRGAEKLYGYSESEAIVMDMRATFTSDGQATWGDYIKRVMSEEPTNSFISQRLTKEGKTLEVESTVSIYRDDAGKPIGIVTTERDVTERAALLSQLKRLNETLEQRVVEQTGEVNLLAAALSHLGEGILITTAETAWPGKRVVFVNDSMSRITGYSAAELSAMPAELIQGLEKKSATLEWVENESRSARSCVFEVAGIRKSGASYDAEWLVTPLFNLQGELTHFVSIHRDITGRKQIATALHESNERMRAVLNTAADSILSIDGNGVIVAANPATERMFGYSQRELLGQTISMLMPMAKLGEAKSWLPKPTGDDSSPDSAFRIESIGAKKGDVKFDVELTISTVDHFGYFTAIVRDISFRRALQKQVLSIATDEQRRIGQELHDGTGQELTGLSLFAGGIVDLLDQLEAGQGDGDGMPKPQSRRASVDGDGKGPWSVDPSMVAKLRSAANRLAQGLTTANRNVQRLSHGIVPVHLDAEGLRAALEELAVNTNDAQSIRCVLDMPAVVPVENNLTATHLHRIAQESVNNAVRHSRASEIRIALKEDDSRIVLEVHDNGVGYNVDPRCDSSDRSRKNPDGRSPESPSGLQSTGFQSSGLRGLGLEIMNYRAQMIGGVFSITRSEMGGTVVRCEIPKEGLCK
jgi:two-component system, chemotaxis family, CheB/CheR fusion protein